MIVVLTGGTGGAKFVDGLRRVMPPEDITVIVNIGDDLKWWGLSVSPDIDSIIYVMADLLSAERGWGVKNDTFFCLETLAHFGEEAWFKIGDRDLAMHVLRSKLLTEGMTLTQATAEIASRLGVRARILPMTDATVKTRVETAIGDLSFEEYFVKRRYQDKVSNVRFVGAKEATPSPGVLDAIRTAEAILIAPSNPITSIGPILAIPQIRQALRDTPSQVIAVSPIIGDAAVSGPAADLMVSCGLPVSVIGVAEAYQDFLDVLVIDHVDSGQGEQIETSDLHVHCTNTIMRNAEDKTNLARAVLSQISVHAESAKFG